MVDGSIDTAFNQLRIDVYLGIFVLREVDIIILLESSEYGESSGIVFTIFCSSKILS